MSGRRSRLFVAPVIAAALSSAVVCLTDRTARAAGPGGNPDWYRQDPAGARGTDPGRIPASPVGPVAAADGPVDLTATPPPAPPAPPPVPPAALPPDTNGAAPAHPGGVGNGPDPRRPYVPPQPRLPGSFYPSSSFTAYGGPSDYPANQFNNYAAAMARAAMARAMFRRAQSELDAALRDEQRRFEQSADMRQAVAAEKDAYNAMTTARRKALQSTFNEERYQRLASLRQDLHEKLQAGRATRSLSQDEILVMAQLRMKYGTEMHEMEADALNADAGVRDAQDRLVAAGSRVAELRQRHDDAARRDETLLMARRNVEDARIARLTAEAYLSGTITAAGTALDAYYYARTPYRGYWPNGYAGNYGYGGYGPYFAGY